MHTVGGTPIPPQERPGRDQEPGTPRPSNDLRGNSCTGKVDQELRGPHELQMEHISVGMRMKDP